MAATTRFYLPAEGSGVPNISPAFDSGWEQTGEATRLKLLYKPSLSVLSTLANTTNRTIPITTTQDVLCNQFVGDPMPTQIINSDCKFSAVIRVAESVSTANANMRVVVRVVSQDGSIVRGTLFSTDGATEFPVPVSEATRIISQQSITALLVQPGDRIVVELGSHLAGPTTSGTYYMRQGNSAATDFALTSGLTTDLNPWVEFSTDLYGTVINNFQFLKVGDGMSVSEKIR